VPIALQASITISYMPELLDNGDVVQNSGTLKPSRSEVSGPKVILPRWIGKTFKRRPLSSSSGSHGGGKKSPHWRQWHWRTQRYGPKNELTKVIRIDTYRTGGSDVVNN
jgi:hypothetical protein